MDLYNSPRGCFKLEVLPDGLVADWSDGLRGLNDGSPPWLTESFVREQSGNLGFDAELEQVLVDGLAMFQLGFVLPCEVTQDTWSRCEQRDEQVMEEVAAR